MINSLVHWFYFWCEFFFANGTWQSALRILYLYYCSLGWGQFILEVTPVINKYIHLKIRVLSLAPRVKFPFLILLLYLYTQYAYLFRHEAADGRLADISALIWACVCYKLGDTDRDGKATYGSLLNRISLKFNLHVIWLYWEPSVGQPASGKNPKRVILAICWSSLMKILTSRRTFFSSCTKIKLYEI